MSSFDWQAFGAKLRKLRHERNLSLANASEMLKIAKSTLAGLEYGRRGASFEILIALATFFNVSTDYLLGLSDDPTPSQHRGSVSKIEEE